MVRQVQARGDEGQAEEEEDEGACGERWWSAYRVAFNMRVHGQRTAMRARLGKQDR